MENKIIDGKKISSEILDTVAKKISKMHKKPKLGILLVGNDEASKIYVEAKRKKCEQVGIHCEIYELASNISQKELLNKIKALNNSDEVNGIIVQLPLPNHINKMQVIQQIKPEKDVDGLTFENSGKLLTGETSTSIIPATASAVMQALEFTHTNLQGKHAVIINRSELVGKPLISLLLNKNCTVTVCHSKTKNLETHTKNADVLISAVGKKNFISKEMIKPGAICIDVGISRQKGSKKIFGDFSEKVSEVASFYTPVPGGVGPITVACLIQNTFQAFKYQQQ